MGMNQLPTSRKIHLLQFILIVQVLGTGFFAFDALSDVTGLENALPFLELHWLEFLVSLSLFISIIVSIRLLGRLNAERKKADDALAMAKGAFGEIVQARMQDWGLTASEREVALFAIKGLDTASIAGVRGSAVGTVKAQLTSVYRKAQVSGRAQLISLFVDELVDGID